MNLPNLNLSKPSLFSKLKKLFIFLLTLLISIFTTALLTSLISALSSNIQLSSITGQITFNPLITIAYIITYHYSAYFFALPKSTSFKFFILTLFLSFTTTFVSGSIFLLTFMFFVKKFFSSPSFSQPQE